jgi:CubicO group peptidase (beta-lactamase class C family)
VSARLPRQASPESVGLSSSRLARLEEHLSRRIEKGELAGTATAVTRQGRLAHLRFQGLADRGRGAPIAEDTIYHVYSMSKPVTAVAALALMEEGLFDLDDPVAQWIPELGRLKVVASATDRGLVLTDAVRPVTVRHLFTHTSGFPYPGSQGSPAERAMSAILGGDDFRTPDKSLREWMELISRAPLAHQPGEGFTYGISTDILGRLVEVLSGMDLESFMQERIFHPLGMADTSFCLPDAKASRLAVVYGADGKGGMVVHEGLSRAYGTQPKLFSGGGGLYSTVPDYLRFAQMLVNGGELDGARVLGRATTALMRADHVRQIAHLPAVKDGSAFGRGCTFGLAGRVAVEPFLLHGSPGTYSWDGAAGTTFLVDPAEDLVAVFFTQVGPWPARLHEHFHTLVYQALV